jgi:hypothetical protein
MKPELIVMLTHHDQTVANALELFDELKDLPVKHWGFKDVGLSTEGMGELVSLSEAEGLAGAKLAVETGFDVLMGTVFFDSIQRALKGTPVKYYPFPGHVFDHPSILDGTIEEICAHALSLEAKGVDGLDLLAYRYTGDAPRLLREVAAAVHVPLVSAGSVATFERIAEIWRTQTWGFTIGSAFFDGTFVPGGSFKDNLMAVWNWLEDERRMTEVEGIFR